MKVFKEFSPTTIVLETEDELKLITEAVLDHYYKYANGWHVIGGHAAKIKADRLKTIHKSLEVFAYKEQCFA